MMAYYAVINAIAIYMQVDPMSLSADVNLFITILNMKDFVMVTFE